MNLTDASECLLVEINETGSKVRSQIASERHIDGFRANLATTTKTLQVVLASEVDGEHKPDVSINISSSDLAGVLKVGHDDDDDDDDEDYDDDNDEH